MPDLARFIPSLPTLDLTGALDILLVAFVVYEALTVVRGTRAGHILIGILTMVSIYALASWTGLEALRSLLSFIVPYIGLAIIVLFQSEIRRTLARIGRKNWFGLAKGFRAPEALSEIMMAAEHLNVRPAGMFYVGVKGGIEYAGWSDDQSMDSLALPEKWLETARERTLRIVEEIRRGRVEIVPADRDSCRFCDSKDICRIEVAAAATATANEAEGA